MVVNGHEPRTKLGKFLQGCLLIIQITLSLLRIRGNDDGFNLSSRLIFCLQPRSHIRIPRCSFRLMGNCSVITMFLKVFIYNLSLFSQNCLHCFGT